MLHSKYLVTAKMQAWTALLPLVPFFHTPSCSAASSYAVQGIGLRIWHAIQRCFVCYKIQRPKNDGKQVSLHNLHRWKHACGSGVALLSEMWLTTVNIQNACSFVLCLLSYTRTPLLQPPTCEDYPCTSGTLKESLPPASFGLSPSDETCCTVSI